MKIFYYGHVCSQELFNETVAKSKVKPSGSAQYFGTALIKGLSAHNNVDLTIASTELTASYPRGNRLLLKKRADILTERATAHILPAVNLPGIKQLQYTCGAVNMLRKWLKENRDDSNKCVLVYNIQSSLVYRLLKECKRQQCKIFAIVADRPTDQDTRATPRNIIHTLLRKYSSAKAIAAQRQFDGYVYLTEAMKDVVAPGKPYIVMEALVDTTLFDKIKNVQKSSPPALMYAGVLSKELGIDLILDSYAKIKTECELWLFGPGNYGEELKLKAQANPRIHYFGCVSREEVLQREKEATLLLNLRNPGDEYTKYSFPSKMVEYMLSGTPLLTTKLAGIPDEYYACCYTIKERTPASIAAKIESLLTSEDLEGMGARARAFVFENKNSIVQTGKILDFFRKQFNCN